MKEDPAARPQEGYPLRPGQPDFASERTKTPDEINGPRKSFHIYQGSKNRSRAPRAQYRGDAPKIGAELEGPGRAPMAATVR